MTLKILFLVFENNYDYKKYTCDINIY